MAEEKQWREGTQISIGELRDLWDANNKLEVAKCLILGIKEINLPLEEKVEFLRNIFPIHLSKALRNENLKTYIIKPILDTFLTLVPEWKEEFSNFGRTILFLLSHRDSVSMAEGLSGRIKKFVHSYLNKVKKENMNEYVIADVLIYHGMFEELVNYNFISDNTTDKLFDFIFPPEKFASRYESKFGLEQFRVWINNINNLEYRKEKLKSFLFSWDKVENRHALATLWTLLAKRGDLKKIFEDEKAEEIKKAE
jgi:hypothetical protein